MSLRNMHVGALICPNGHTIYCSEKNPCDGCVRRAKAEKDLRRIAKRLRKEGKLPKLFTLKTGGQ